MLGQQSSNQLEHQVRELAQAVLRLDQLFSRIDQLERDKRSSDAKLRELERSIKRLTESEQKRIKGDFRSKLERLEGEFEILKKSNENKSDIIEKLQSDHQRQKESRRNAFSKVDTNINGIREKLERDFKLSVENLQSQNDDLASSLEETRNAVGVLKKSHDAKSAKIEQLVTEQNKQKGSMTSEFKKVKSDIAGMRATYLSSNQEFSRKLENQSEITKVLQVVSQNLTRKVVHIDEAIQETFGAIETLEDEKDKLFKHVVKLNAEIKHLTYTSANKEAEHAEKLMNVLQTIKIQENAVNNMDINLKVVNSSLVDFKSKFEIHQKLHKEKSAAIEQLGTEQNVQKRLVTIEFEKVNSDITGLRETCQSSNRHFTNMWDNQTEIIEALKDANVKLLQNVDKISLEVDQLKVTTTKEAVDHAKSLENVLQQIKQQQNTVNNVTLYLQKVNSSLEDFKSKCKQLEIDHDNVTENNTQLNLKSDKEIAKFNKKIIEIKSALNISSVGLQASVNELVDLFKCTLPTFKFLLEIIERV